MIHVSAQKEPDSFDAEVRQKGLAWLRKNAIPLELPLPPKTKLKPYWQSCLDEMHTSYNGYCAYLAVYIERVISVGSVDHFIPKLNRVDLAYEWSNYRLACSRMNSRKRDFEDVLDPFEVETGWFRLEPVTGRIYPNPSLSAELKGTIQTTIDRLGLDDAGNRGLRARYFHLYCSVGYPEKALKQQSPFVWVEARRQGLL